MSRHHPTLSPSAFPKLNLCVQYWPDPVVGKAADRGSNLHSQIESHHQHGTPITDKGAAGAYARAKRYISDVRGVEQTLQLIDADLKELTFGTADMWGYNEDGTLTLVDYKSGTRSDPRSYMQQMAVYALMLMEQTGEESCFSWIVGIDTGNDHVEVWTLENAREIVYGIIERVQAQDEPAVVNQYCKWCQKRTTCPTRLSPAIEVISSTEIVPTEMRAMAFTKEWITASPSNASRFLKAYKRLQEVVEDIDPSGIVKSALESGEVLEGWTLQRRKGASRLDTKAVKQRWSELTDEPIPSSIGEDTVSLVEAK
jgi:hypothetical protein